MRRAAFAKPDHVPHARSIPVFAGQLADLGLDDRPTLRDAVARARRTPNVEIISASDGRRPHRSRRRQGIPVADAFAADLTLKLATHADTAE